MKKLSQNTTGGQDTAEQPYPVNDQYASGDYQFPPEDNQYSVDDQFTGGENQYTPEDKEYSEEYNFT